jgi:hypothetical protein
MARSLAGLWLGVALLAACATGPDKYDPHNPGDHCLDSCPEGMACTGVTYSRRRTEPYPGRCELQPGRCADSADCARSARCVRTSDRMGLCAEAPQL